MSIGQPDIGLTIASSSTLGLSGSLCLMGYLYGDEIVGSDNGVPDNGPHVTYVMIGVLVNIVSPAIVT